MKLDLNKIGNIKKFASVDIISDYIDNNEFYVRYFKSFLRKNEKNGNKSMSLEFDILKEKLKFEDSDIKTFNILESTDDTAFYYALNDYLTKLFYDNLEKKIQPVIFTYNLNNYNNDSFVFFMDELSKKIYEGIHVSNANFMLINCNSSIIINYLHYVENYYEDTINKLKSNCGCENNLYLCNYKDVDIYVTHSIPSNTIILGYNKEYCNGSCLALDNDIVTNKNNCSVKAKCFIGNTGFYRLIKLKEEF
jgi:hypothetical protein